MALTSSLEEYLKVMYILKNTKEEIRVTDIANKLNKSKASVNSAINTLKEDGYVNYEPYGKIELTLAGIKEATKIIEKNDIVQLFLTDVIGADKKNAINEAAKVKSFLSDDSLNKLAKFTNKTLGLTDLDCGYDINNERCVKCPRRTK